MANLKLTQYLVRLKFDDVEKPKPLPKKQKVVEKRKRRSQMDPDFDSEEEYGNEDVVSSDSSEAEYDDGKDFDSEEGEASMEEKIESSEEESEEEEDINAKEDRYQMDPFVCRREATLLCLVKKTFKERCIVFFNEKVQCNRALNLFTMFGLRAAQVQGNLPQNERMEAVEKF